MVCAVDFSMYSAVLFCSTPHPVWFLALGHSRKLLSQNTVGEQLWQDGHSSRKVIPSLSYTLVTPTQMEKPQSFLLLLMLILLTLIISVLSCFSFCSSFLLLCICPHGCITSCVMAEPKCGKGSLLKLQWR